MTKTLPHSSVKDASPLSLVKARSETFPNHVLGVFEPRRSRPGLDVCQRVCGANMHQAAMVNRSTQRVVAGIDPFHKFGFKNGVGGWRISVSKTSSDRGARCPPLRCQCRSIQVTLTGRRRWNGQPEWADCTFWNRTSRASPPHSACAKGVDVMAIGELKCKDTSFRRSHGACGCKVSLSSGVRRSETPGRFETGWTTKVVDRPGEAPRGSGCQFAGSSQLSGLAHERLCPS